MTRYRCQVCDPSCTLEVRGYADIPPHGCPFVFDTPEWNVIGAKKKAKVVRRAPAKKAPVQKVEHTVAGFRLL